MKSRRLFDIIWVAPSLKQLGGSEYAISTHARLLAEAGHHIRLVTGPAPHPAWHLQLAGVRGVDIVVVEDDMPETFCQRVERLVHEQRPNLIQFLPIEDHCLLWLRRSHAVPVVGIEPTDFSGHCWWLSNDMKEMIHRLSALLVLNPIATQHALQQYRYNGPIFLVPNTVSVAERLPDRNRDDCPPTVACISRLSAEKGVEFLLATFRLLPDRHSHVQLDLWGDGEDRIRLQQLACMLGIESRVNFRGAFDPFHDIAEIVTNSDIFALSSMFEGAPIALLEVVARGRAVVASDTTGARWICGDAYRWLIPVGDTRAMANAIAALLDDADMRHSAAISLHSRFLGVFAPEHTLHAYESAYAYTLGSGKVVVA